MQPAAPLASYTPPDDQTVPRPHGPDPTTQLPRLSFVSGSLICLRRRVRQAPRRAAQFSQSALSKIAQSPRPAMTSTPSLSFSGDEYARRLGAWVPQHVYVQHGPPHPTPTPRHPTTPKTPRAPAMTLKPSLSFSGEEYARRLGAWVPQHVYVQHGAPVKCRLWTSSLQR
jgi:hypothetical protein